ncbi:MAG TPA: hypothetical protein VF544_14535 [Pyrinomonadaceae bacterium]
MNTRTRRLVLRLIVGLLTFLIGVTAAVVLGGFNPLERRQVRQRARRCAEYARPAPSISAPVLLPDAPVAQRPVYPVYRPEIRFSRTPVPLPKQAAAPILPSFEDRGEVKSAKPVVRSHGSQ